ncbi:hypothetical protein ACJJTC_017281 [Scirpophaga incertulas]
MPRIRRHKNQKLFLMLISLNFLTTVAPDVRHKRYLVYPDGAPARAQFIIGLGIPVDLKEASVTVGTVIKFQYDLPTNSSEYTSRIYGFASTINSRDMNINQENKNEENVLDSNSINEDGEDLESNDNNNSNNTLVDVVFDVNRRKRSIVYAKIPGDNLETSTEIPLEEAIRRQEELDRKYLEKQKPQRMNRWDFYKILEHMSERYGYSGRPCLLRTICEAAEVPFTHENGLLAEIGHILFTPSTTKDELSHHTDNEYHAAERLGQDPGINCELLFPKCEGSILDTFTEIGEDTKQEMFD